MKTLQSTEIYTEWGEQFDEDEVKAMREDLKKMFGDQIELIIVPQDGGFTIKILKENEK